MCRGTAVNAGRIRIDALSHRRRRPSGTPRTTRAGLGHRTPPVGRGIRAQGVRERPDSQTGSPPTWCHQRSERHSPDHATRRARLTHQCRHGLGARMRPASYVRSSLDARITTCFSADEPWQTSHGPLLVTIRPSRRDSGSLVDQTFASWNRVTRWLGHLDQLRLGAWPYRNTREERRD